MRRLRSPVFWPIKRTCADCHADDDYHKGGFDREMILKGQSCEMCHDARDWKRDTYRRDSHPEPIALSDGHSGKCEVCVRSTMRTKRAGIVYLCLL